MFTKVTKVQKVEKKIVAPKKAATETKAPVESKTPAEPKERKIQMSPNLMCRNLLLERTSTDEEIVQKVLAVFPQAKFNQSYVSTTRIDLNKGFYKSAEVGEALVKMVEFDGKRISYEEYKQSKIAKALEEKEKAKVEKVKKAEEKKQAAAAKAEEKKKAADEKAKAKAEKVAADKKVKEEKAAADKKAKEEKAAADKKAAQEKAEAAKAQKAIPASTSDGMYSGPVVGNIPPTTKIKKVVKK